MFAHRADCKLRLLDFVGALDDAMDAVDMYKQEQREKQVQPCGRAGSVRAAAGHQQTRDLSLRVPRRARCPRRQRPS